MIPAATSLASAGSLLRISSHLFSFEGLDWHNFATPTFLARLANSTSPAATGSCSVTSGSA